jgi:MFS family permease
MEKKQIYVLLTCIIVVSFALRLYFAFSSPYFSDDTSYWHLRQIEFIKDHAYPQFNDPLSFSGRLFLFSPIFHYLFAFLTYIGSTWYLTKVLPNLFATALIPIIYVLVNEMTKSRQIAVFTACIAAFIPIYFVETVNALSVRSLSIPLTFLFLYFFYNIQKQKNKTWCIVLVCILIFLDPASLVILLGLVVYLFLLKISYMEAKKEEKEFIFFSLLLALWFYLLLYKSSLVRHGIEILWQNIPQQMIDKYYFDITIITSIYHIGIVPLIFGLVVVFFALFEKSWRVNEHQHHKEHRKAIYMIIGIIAVATMLLWFKMIEFSVGLLYLSILLVILSGFGYMEFHEYLQKTKAKRWSNWIFTGVFLLFIVSSVVPTVHYSNERIASTITTKEVAFLRFLPEIAREEDVVLGLVDDGHYIEYFAGRKTVADTNFLQIQDTKQRLEDINTLFTTQSKIVATRIMNKYNAKYIYISPTAKKLYGIDYLSYEDNDCFRLVYVGDVRLYESTCK